MGAFLPLQSIVGLFIAAIPVIINADTVQRRSQRYRPLSDDNIIEAVNEFMTNPFQAKTIWGPIENWDVSDVTNFSDLFRNLKYFNSDISQWDTKKATKMFSMFQGAEMFNVDISNWDVSNVIDMEGMFKEAISFNQDLSKWVVSKSRSCWDMFRDAKNFSSDLSQWDTSRVENMDSMFRGASKFTSDLSKWDVSKVTLLRYMFKDAALFNSDLSSWDVASVENMWGMFEHASSFNSDLSQWDVSSVIDMDSMFKGASLFSSNLSAWNTSKVVVMLEMFSGATSFNSDLNWDVSKISDMTDMFVDARSFNGDISRWDVSNTLLMWRTFSGASSFNGDLSRWDVSNVRDMEAMFQDAVSFNSNVSGWNVALVEVFTNMFSGAKSFSQSLCWSIRSDKVDGIFECTACANNECGAPAECPVCNTITAIPSSTPTSFPSNDPTLKPSINPSFKPSKTPSNDPTLKPSITPSFKPSKIPSSDPTLKPSTTPSFKPSKHPSNSPTYLPTAKPSITSFPTVTCTADTANTFIISKKGGRTCQDLKLPMYDWACEKIKFKRRCPITCNVCSLEPSNTPSVVTIDCSDSKESFDIGNNLGKTCTDLNRKKYKWACKREEIAKFCPVTCNLCGPTFPKNPKEPQITVAPSINPVMRYTPSPSRTTWNFLVKILPFSLSLTLPMDVMIGGTERDLELVLQDYVRQQLESMIECNRFIVDLSMSLSYTSQRHNLFDRDLETGPIQLELLYFDFSGNSIADHCSFTFNQSMAQNQMQETVDNAMSYIIANNLKMGSFIKEQSSNPALKALLGFSSTIPSYDLCKDNLNDVFFRAGEQSWSCAWLSCSIINQIQHCRSPYYAQNVCPDTCERFCSGFQDIGSCALRRPA